MTISDRIKRYELSSNGFLLLRGFIIIRVDGRAFHTFTRKFKKPFDNILIESMVSAGERCAKEMSGFRLGYHQSDEFTFAISDLESYESEMWFGGKIQKIASISASMFTAYFNECLELDLQENMGSGVAMFDSRCFNVPVEDVANVFIWRQRDWERNSIQMFSRNFFSHKELMNKKTTDMHEMLHGIGENWANLEPKLKNGTFITKDGKRINEKLDYESINKLLISENK